jgi:hypothetical protein
MQTATSSGKFVCAKGAVHSGRKTRDFDKIAQLAHYPLWSRVKMVRARSVSGGPDHLIAWRAGGRDAMGDQPRGAYMITMTPTKHTAAPITSNRSGRKPSATIPHNSDPTTNTPP